MVHDFAGAKPTGYAGPNLASGPRLARTAARSRHVMTLHQNRHIVRIGHGLNTGREWEPQQVVQQHVPQRRAQDRALGHPIVDLPHDFGANEEPHPASGTDARPESCRDWRNRSRPILAFARASMSGFRPGLLQCVRRHRLWAWPARFDVTVTSPRRATLSAETPCSAATRQLAISLVDKRDRDSKRVTGEIGGFHAAAIVVSHAPSGITILEDADGLRDGKRPRESPGEENLAAKPRLETESDSEQVAAAPHYGGKEEMMRTVHDSVKAISALVAGPGSKLNKADISSVAAYGHEILAVVAALNLRLAEAELQVAQAKLEAARASRVAAVSGGSEAVVTAQPRSYASALRLPGRERADIRKPESGPVLAIYPVAEQIDNIKTAEETKTLLKNAINPASMQVQVTKVRKVGRAGVVVQTTSAESAEKIRRRSRPRCGVRDPKWTLDRLAKECRVAFKNPVERPITTVVLECSPELRDLLVSLDRVLSAGRRYQSVTSLM
ncbi:hypothetical protein EVAR_89989_1 [Eumeta japonica]|uniref:Uncharacterized protein n=1 Tax=Eumeta variegata TaxID=151549 RepID=A0A4C2ABS7_EUMVA|nr:hypothetical protein EVAR_89989_1 [Eumeta japonica]